MTTEKYYNIHDIITFRIVNNASTLDKLIPFWDIELRGFESGKKGEPDFTIFLGKFSPQNMGCSIIDDRFYIKEDYLYCTDSHKYAKWRLEMTGFEESHMEVHISSNLFGWMFITEWVINPLIWFKLNQKGYALVHGSGVVKDGQAYIFAGRGAAGKSLIALSLIEKGFRLLGDHFVILNNDTALSFPSPLHIESYNLTPLVKNRMKAKHKILLTLNQLSLKVAGLHTEPRISPKALLPDLIEDKAKLHSIFLLLPREKFKVEKIDKGKMSSHLVSNQKLESFPFFTRYMLEYSYLFPQSSLATYWARYNDNLGHALGIAQGLYRTQVSPSYDDETLDSIYEVIKNE